MSLGTSWRFRSERFDYRSELPSACNAGNRFYGRDVGEFIVQGLAPRGLSASVIDEDWGWLVTGVDAEGRPFEVAIYNLSDHREGGQPGCDTWGLAIRAFERRRLLGLLPRLVEVPVPTVLAADLRDTFAQGGIAVEPWDDSADADA